MMASEAAWGSGIPWLSACKVGEKLTNFPSSVYVAAPRRPISFHLCSLFSGKPIPKDVPTVDTVRLVKTAMQNEWERGLWNFSMHVGFDSSSMMFDNRYAVSMLLRQNQAAEPRLERGTAGGTLWSRAPDEMGVFIIL